MKDLYWLGVLELCDLCGDYWPMSWITFTGKQFLCGACICEVEL